MAIEKRTGKDGKPAYRVRIADTHPVTGRRQNKTVGTYRTKKEAEKAERDALTQQERGTLVDPKTTTIAELLDAWLATKAGSVSPNSHKDYEIAIRRHLKPAFGNVRAQRLAPAQVQARYDAWTAGGMSARMIHRCHIVLSQALAQGLRFGIVTRNVSADVDKPSIARSKPQVWTPDEVSAFLSASLARPILTRAGNTGKTRPDDLTPLWHFLVLEGMRRGEALGLRWSDVNWDRGAVHISQTIIPDKSNKGAALIRPRTKTSAGARSVKLTRDTLAVLEAHRDRQRFQRQAAGDAWHDHDLIICTSTGTPVNPNNVARSYTRLLIRSGVRAIRVHDMRHTAATMLLRAGVPAKIVSERLGHAGVGITLDLYSHVTPDMQDEAAEAISAILAKANATA
jgi:integrase